jgi:hypothetical protein
MSKLPSISVNTDALGFMLFSLNTICSVNLNYFYTAEAQDGAIQAKTLKRKSCRVEYGRISVMWDFGFHMSCSQDQDQESAGIA